MPKKEHRLLHRQREPWYTIQHKSRKAHISRGKMRVKYDQAVGTQATHVYQQGDLFVSQFRQH